MDMVLYREFVAYLLSTLSPTEGLMNILVGMQDWLLFQGSLPSFPVLHNKTLLSSTYLLSNEVLSNVNLSVCLVLQQREILPFTRAELYGGNWEAKMNLLAPVCNLHLLYFHGAKVTITVSSKKG